METKITIHFHNVPTGGFDDIFNNLIITGDDVSGFVQQIIDYDRPGLFNHMANVINRAADLKYNLKNTKAPMPKASEIVIHAEWSPIKLLSLVKKI